MMNNNLIGPGAMDATFGNLRSLSEERELGVGGMMGGGPGGGHRGHHHHADVMDSINSNSLASSASLMSGPAGGCGLGGLGVTAGPWAGERCQELCGGADGDVVGDGCGGCLGGVGLAVRTSAAAPRSVLTREWVPSRFSPVPLALASLPDEPLRSTPAFPLPPLPLQPCRAA